MLTRTPNGPDAPSPSLPSEIAEKKAPDLLERPAWIPLGAAHNFPECSEDSEDIPFGISGLALSYIFL